MKFIFHQHNLCFKLRIVLSLIIFSIGNLTFLKAEGSRDLYPSGVQGNRAFLSSMACTSCNFNPFATLGRQFVYAKSGETIYMGSSVQGVNNGTIKVYAPNGAYYTSGGSTTIGKIANRSQELAGPKIGTTINTNGYTPYSITVKPEEEGIWVVEFLPRASVSATIGNNPSTTSTIAVAANAEWSSYQTSITNFGTSNSGAFIAAWDVTVASGSGNSSQLKTGRVLTTVFAGAMSATSGFYGNFYALTKDGFCYLIKNNGNNGQSFK